MLLEDLGALLGLVLALFGITMAVFTGDPRWDGVGSLAIGTLLLCIAVFLAFEVSGLLVGESALPEQEAAIRTALGAAAASTRSSTCARCTPARTSCWSP